MSFVMIASGASASSTVRTLGLRPIVLGASLAALLLLGAGAALGFWAAQAAGGGNVATAAAAASAEPASPSVLPLALEQLGAISGRLFQLESQAAQLARRIGVLQKDEPRPRPPGGPGSGGPLLPPQIAPDDLAVITSQLEAVEERIALVADAATLRSLELMRLPTRIPVADAALRSTFGNRADPFTGNRAFHAGLDFAAEHGAPIVAAAGGTVGFAGFRPDYGWTVEIEHGNGLATRYAHASKLLVARGAIVKPGERIANVGSTGRSTGAHLHFEVLRHGEPIDPRRYLAGL